MAGSAVAQRPFAADDVVMDGIRLHIGCDARFRDALFTQSAGDELCFLWCVQRQLGIAEFTIAITVKRGDHLRSIVASCQPCCLKCRLTDRGAVACDPVPSADQIVGGHPGCAVVAHCR